MIRTKPWRIAIPSGSNRDIRTFEHFKSFNHHLPGAFPLLRNLRFPVGRGSLAYNDSLPFSHVNFILRNIIREKKTSFSPVNRSITNLRDNFTFKLFQIFYPKFRRVNVLRKIPGYASRIWLRRLL